MTNAGTNAFMWASGVESGMVNGTATPIGPTPADFIAHLRKFPGFTMTEPVPVTVDGISGSKVDILSNGVEAPGMFVIPEDAFNMGPGEKIRFIALDKDGATVILMVNSFVAADFDQFDSEVGQPMLDGLTWE